MRQSTLVPKREVKVRIPAQAGLARFVLGPLGRIIALAAALLVIAGVATSNGVEVTARQAHELGFNITLAIDAMTGSSAEAHDYSVTRVFPRIGETGATREILELLENGAHA